MKKIIFIISFFTVLVFSGCRKNPVQETFSAPYSTDGVAAGKIAPLMAMSRNADSADFSKSVENSVSLESENLVSENGRKLIKSGDISFEVHDLEKADSAVLEWVKAFGGYVAGTKVNAPVPLFARIDSEKLLAELNAQMEAVKKAAEEEARKAEEAAAYKVDPIA